MSKANLQKLPPLNVIPKPLYTYSSLSLVFSILVAPNKQFLNLNC